MAWFDANWDYRRAIAVTNNVASDLTDFQVLFTIDTAALVTAGKMEADGDDIRFADLAGTLQDYWIESGMNTNATKIWVEVKTIGASATKDIYLYYGYAAAAAATSGADTFEEFFDKDSTAGWSLYGGLTVTTSGDYLRFYNPVTANVGQAIRFDLTLPTKYILEAKFHTTSLSTNDLNWIILCDGVITNRKSMSFMPKYNSQAEWGYYLGAYNIIGAFSEGTEYIYKIYNDDANAATGTNYYLLDLSRSVLSSATGKGVSTGTVTDTDGIYLGDGSGGGVSDAYYQWMIFRQYATTEPTHGAPGDEETDTPEYATAPTDVVLAVGASDPVGGVTNVAIPGQGETDTTGAVTGWVTATADRIKFTVTDGGAATSVITIGGGAYTSGNDYEIPSTANLTVIVTTSEAGKTDAVRTFTITVAAAPPAWGVTVEYLPILTPDIDTAITTARTGANNIYSYVPICNDKQLMFIHISQ